MSSGLPSSDYYRKTNHLFLIEGKKDFLLAGTDGGLFLCDLGTEQWQEIPLGEKPERVIKILQVKEKIVVFTESSAFICTHITHSPAVEKMRMDSGAGSEKISLVRLFFDVHDGKAWGLAGQLLYDLVGLIIIFLSVSAFYMWYFPWIRRKFRRKTRMGNKYRQFAFKYFYKYHFKLGIWVALILLLMGGTAFFMRPPVLAVIANGNVPRSWYPGSLPTNPWDKKLKNALYDGQENRIILQTTEGFWAGSAEFNKPFKPLKFPVPVFVMGATVLEPYGEGGFLVGSFNGIFHLERHTGKVIDLLTGKEAANISSVRPAEFMVTGYFRTPAGEAFITTHQQGLLPLGKAELRNRFKMPENVRKNYRMPLWNYMFELHNGRIFKDLIGGFYILIAPLGSLIFVLITVTGIFDWVFLKLFRKRKLNRLKKVR